MIFKTRIPTPNGRCPVTISSGHAAVFVGANGSGKTSLSVYFGGVHGEKAHRIPAQKSLSLDPKVVKIPQDQALAGLRFGTDQEGFHSTEHRTNNRWKSPTHFVRDYDFLLQALFADQANTSLLAYHSINSGAQGSEQQFRSTKFDQLKDIWQRLLPRRKLHITGDNISVSSSNRSGKYLASVMSDGERAIFYMIGQALVAAENQLLIIDEPEQHLHPSIMSKLWNELEAARTDCAFIYFTHDLTFAATRNAQKYVIHELALTATGDNDNDNDNVNLRVTWDVKCVPDDTGFSEEITTLMLGSRQPILFVEGTENSLDLPIYRACYPEWTVIPRSSCTDVIHSVVAMRKNDAFTRVTCTGIVDGDDYDKREKERIENLGIHILSVSEIENLLLLPSVTASILEIEGYVGANLVKKQDELKSAIFKTLDNPKMIEEVVVEYCKRRIDRSLKKVDLSTSKTPSELQGSYESAIGEIDIAAIATQRTNEIKAAIVDEDLTKLLEYYDNKGLIAIAASHLKNQRRDNFKSWIVRSLRNETSPSLKMSLLAALPKITHS